MSNYTYLFGFVSISYDEFMLLQLNLSNYLFIPIENDKKICGASSKKV